MKLKEYWQVFTNGQTRRVSGLCGRIIRGQKSEDFKTLTDDPNRKLVMLMGPDGLESLLGKTGYDMLVEIGYEPDYIVRKVEEGNQFKLVVFAEGGAAQLATWDNVALVAGDVYPEVAPFLRRYLTALEDTPFSEIERQAGFDFSEVDKAGPDDPRFMTYERFKRSTGSLIPTKRCSV